MLSMPFNWSDPIVLFGGACLLVLFLVYLFKIFKENVKTVLLIVIILVGIVLGVIFILPSLTG